MSKQSSKLTNKLNKLLENTGDMALKRRARRIIEELDPQNGEKILDVGCGDGYYLYLLSNLGIKLDLFGVDSDPNALKSARRNLKGKRIRFFQVDLMQGLPFDSESFDKAVMSEVAEHLPDDVKGLKEVKRILKQGGTLVLTVPNHNYPFLWDPVNWMLEHISGTYIKSGFWAGLWNQHLRLYRPAQIRSVVQKTGLEVKKIESLTWWCLPFNHYFLNLAAINLHSENFSPDVANAVNKFNSQGSQPVVVSLVFKLVNLVDKLNNIYRPRDRGVGVLVKAIK